MRSVRDIGIYENIPILVRAALNEPVHNGTVIDTFRLRRAVPTIEFLASRGARVVLISHIDPPGGVPAQGTETLAPVAGALQKLVRHVSFCPATIGPQARAAIRAMAPGAVLVLENLRRDAREKKNDPSFAKELSALADVFVQDSFDTAHRMHASIIGVPQFLPSYAGLLLEAEVGALSLARKPKRPALAVIGGAKFGTKERLLEALLASYTSVFAGGALANDFMQALGQNVGASLTSGSDPTALVKLARHPNLVLPLDSIVVKKGEFNLPDAPQRARVAERGDVRADDIMADHGPRTNALLAELAGRAESVLWNGPLGSYERGFVEATDAFAKAVAASSAHSVIGGGDTVAAIESLGILSRFSFVSTGGGAMLDFLAEGTLPGIEALR